jgi:replicative DNA helicase
VTFNVAVVFDAFSRMPLSVRVFSTEASAREIAQYGLAPAPRLESHQDATMLLVAVSDAVERFEPSTEAVVLLDTEAGYEVVIVRPDGMEDVGGLEFGLAN